MIPSKVAIQEATLTRLSDALSAEVGTDPGVPGVEIGDDTETAVRETTNSVHTDVPHTIRSRAYTEREAKQTGLEVVKQLTDRDDKLPLSAPFDLLRSELVDMDMQRNRRAQGRDIFTDIIIIQHRVSRS